MDIIYLNIKIKLHLKHYRGLAPYIVRLLAIPSIFTVIAPPKARRRPTEKILGLPILLHCPRMNFEDIDTSEKILRSSNSSLTLSYNCYYLVDFDLVCFILAKYR
jgi:hypothetical protein